MGGGAKSAGYGAGGAAGSAGVPPASSDASAITETALRFRGPSAGPRLAPTAGSGAGTSGTAETAPVSLATMPPSGESTQCRLRPRDCPATAARGRRDGEPGRESGALCVPIALPSILHVVPCSPLYHSIYEMASRLMAWIPVRPRGTRLLCPGLYRDALALVGVRRILQCHSRPPLGQW